VVKIFFRGRPENKELNMPTISMFYGILIRMFFKDNEKHSLPHIHADYQGQVAIYSIPDGNVLADWELAVHGKKPFTIKGLDQ
jgi:hypothetical protein